MIETIEINKGSKEIQLELITHSIIYNLIF